MNSVKAIAPLTMTTNENETFTIDFTSYLRPLEKIIGIVSVTLSPSVNAPAISDVGYNTLGKHVSFRIDATGGSVLKKTYKLSAIVTTQLAKDIQDRREALADLIVC